MSNVFPRSMKTSYPVAVAGEGCYIIDESRKRYLDGSGGAAVSCLGHSHPAVTGAIKAQLDRLASRAGMPSDSTDVAFARFLLKLMRAEFAVSVELAPIGAGGSGGEASFWNQGSAGVMQRSHVSTLRTG